MSVKKTEFWVCPVWNCSNMLVFDEPYLDCALHGKMVRDNEISMRKKAYRLFKRKLVKP